ncbi:6,7-dimethyl-8-ribityllumazine synthase [Cutibacterium sp. V947]|uniref:6,7-dimethyl-8-ribityllumazine synthase n=1 Tax=unclassified Cutibacterium TaxID=2649671 RepID=UPI003EE090EC
MSSCTNLGSAAPDLSNVDGGGLQIAIVASQWHDKVMTGLLDGALRGLADAGVVDPVVVRVPGSFELPVACAALADHFDALVALGVVIRGGTPHFDYVCDAATQGITDIAVRTKTPIGFGVLTCDDDAQALDRAGLERSHEDKGYEAAQAAVATFTTLSAVIASRSTQTLRA